MQVFSQSKTYQAKKNVLTTDFSDIIVPHPILHESNAGTGGALTTLDLQNDVRHHVDMHISPPFAVVEFDDTFAKMWKNIRVAVPLTQDFVFEEDDAARASIPEV
jgi:hypothetical protein